MNKTVKIIMMHRDIQYDTNISINNNQKRMIARNANSEKLYCALTLVAKFPLLWWSVEADSLRLVVIAKNVPYLGGQWQNVPSTGS